MCVVNKYYAKDPKYYKIENLLSKLVNDYGKKFQSFEKLCAWKLVFMEGVFNNKSVEIINWRVTNYLRKKLNIIENMDIDSLKYLN